jgi:aminocarboxymuconate-semialdehyde decarboxylase
MKIIDVHTHILPDYIPNWDKQFGYSGFVGLKDAEVDENKMDDKIMMKGEKFFRRVQCNCFNSKQRMMDIDESNVDIQVLSTVPIMFNYWAKPEDCLVTSKYINDHLSSVCKSNPTKYVGLGTLPMQDVNLACQELIRCVKELNLKGVEIGTHVNGKNLDDDSFEPFWKLVEELQAVIFVHPWDMMGSERLEKHWLSWLVAMPAETTVAISSMIFGGVYKKFPKLKVYYAHGGGSFIGTLGRLQKGFDCRPDLYPNQCNPTDYLNHIMVDSLTHDPDMLLKLIKHVGMNNIMLGSDYPFPLGELSIGNLVNTMCSNYLISIETRNRILYLNACDFFNISSLEIKTVSNDDEYNNYDKVLHNRILTEQELPKIKHDPINYSNTVTLNILTLIVQQMCIAYYKGIQLVDNTTYDAITSVLKIRDPDNQILSKEII